MTSYVLNYQITPELQRRAMVSWVQKPSGRGQKLRRVALGVLIYIALVAAIVGLLHYDILGFGVIIAAAAGFVAGLAFWGISHRIHTTKLITFADEALERQGPISAEFDAQQVVIASQVASSTMDWQCFDAVIALPDATALRAGALIYPVPDAALPVGTTPDAFRADLNTWIEAAR